MTKLERRFWAKVDKSGDCWVWTGAKSHGYGMIRAHGRNQYVHRIGWELQKGSIPHGRQVNHHCDNPLCVRASHLYVGTQQDNRNDSVRRRRTAKGDRHNSRTHPERVPRGERHGNAKMTNDLVREMRQRYAAGEISQNDAAREYGIRQATVNAILRGQTWKDAGGPITQKGRPRLSDEQVAAVRWLYNAGTKQAEIARLLGIGYNAVNQLVLGNTHGDEHQHRKTRGGSKLTANAVRKIRADFELGAPQSLLAEDYGVTSSTISAIVHRRTWREVK